jgi:hypothetical protein
VLPLWNWLVGVGVPLLLICVVLVVCGGAWSIRQLALAVRDGGPELRNLIDYFRNIDRSKPALSGKQKARNGLQAPLEEDAA